MTYLALYREWRPKNFKEMVGQEHVRITLTHALLQGKVAHAYLFSGPRGTGKTTAAKILAKALNCTNRDGAEPCNACSSCREIDQGLSLDVLEIDAASNRGIDEIRDLREKVKLVSASGRFKIYIIDEVHMLTPEAFNALLKTLEEPPASVVFVLATTEAHKVPLTILSRVQRFEFHRIAAAGIAERLREVCRTLGREVEEKALQVIAVKAEGGLRDALSILDQCLLQDDPVKVEHVYQAIGMVGETYSADLVDTLLAGDYGSALAKLGEGVALGRDPRQIIRELVDYLRQALLYLAGGQEPLLAEDVAARLAQQSKKAGLPRLLSWLNGLLKSEGELRYAANARLAAEMILVRVLYENEQCVSTNDPEMVMPKTAISSQAKPASDRVHESKKQTDSVPVEKREPLSPGGPGELELNALISRWPEVLEEVKHRKKSTHAFLLEGRPAGLSSDTCYLVFKDGYSFHRDKFNQPENKNVVEAVLEELFGRKLTISNLMEKEYSNLPINKEAKKKVVEPETAGGINEEELCIQKAVEFFGAELVQVRKDE
jgi:DNA polymerase-3 subunit gamma/tau